MKQYSCDHCGAVMRAKKTPEKCILCGEHDFSESDLPSPSDADKKEHELMENALGELDKYMEDTPSIDIKYYNNGE